GERVGVGIAHAEPVAGDVLAMDLARGGPVALHHAPVVEQQPAQACARNAGLRAPIRPVKFHDATVAAVVRYLALEEAAHRVRAADPELLTGDQHVARRLPVHGEAVLPVAAERPVVIEPPAPDEKARICALAQVVAARRAEFGACAVLTAGEVLR